MNIHQKRKFVNDLYPNDKWRKRVSKMPYNQIIAIYLTTISKYGKGADLSPKKDKTNFVIMPRHCGRTALQNQLSMFDILKEGL